MFVLYVVMILALNPEPVGPMGVQGDGTESEKWRIGTAYDL
jgi:hypothetical protein